MAKQTSLFGKVSGKIGSVVFSTAGGETISREYNPHVANPNTMAQVNQRARMKLMSQLSAALSPVIVMQKQGLVSKRNKFTSKNFDASYALKGEAQITYENVQITEGNTSLPAISANGSVDGETGEYRTLGGLISEPSANISRVVYCFFRKSSEGKLEFVSSLIQNDRTAYNQHFGFIGPWENGVEYVIFAYGMSDTSERASVVYGNLNVVSASDLARLVATRAISYQDYQFTQTRAITISADGTAVQPETPGNARVFVTALGTGGTVSGGGSFQIGTEVTVRATPNSGYTFSRWIFNGTKLTASTSAAYTFTLKQQVDLVAVFEGDGNSSL